MQSRFLYSFCYFCTRLQICVLSLQLFNLNWDILRTSRSLYSRISGFPPYCFLIHEYHHQVTSKVYYFKQDIMPVILTYMSTEIFHWGGCKPKILEGGCGQGEKFFSRGGNRAGSKKKFWEGGIGRGEKILSRGGNRAGRKIFWSHFSKILWRGICMGN